MAIIAIDMHAYVSRLTMLQQQSMEMLFQVELNVVLLVPYSEMCLPSMQPASKTTC